MTEVPPPPQGFTPPTDVTGPLMGYTWYMDWKELDPDEAGASTIYDIDNDRVFIAPRPDVYHDEMIRQLVGKSPLPRLPDELSPAAVQTVAGGWQADIPTAAEGMAMALRDFDDRTTYNTGANTEVEWVYKHACAFYMVDIPPEANARIKYEGRGGVKQTVTATIGDLYRELRFENSLPEQKVTYDREVTA